MQYRLQKTDRVGFVRPATDAHTLGLASAAALLEDCGISCWIANADICRAIESPDLSEAIVLLREWISRQHLNVLGFSYRLDAQDGLRFFSGLFGFLRTQGLLAANGGPIRALYFGGLPETCALIEREFPDVAGLFRGDETTAETLGILGVDMTLAPAEFEAGLIYDEARLRFGRELTAKGNHLQVRPVKRSYQGYGSAQDSLVERVKHGVEHGLPPLMRVHVGPYTGDHAQDLRLFLDWTRTLAKAGLLDVLSVGTSQLTQSHFFRDKTGLSDGGGISIHSPQEFAKVWEAARPMLVRTYAGCQDMVRLAKIYDETLNMAWHTMSFWWFCQIDGRGPNSLRENLVEHFATLRQIAAAGKPFEPNVPHHFAFRGADDVSYVVAGFLAAKAAKLYGIRTLVLQVMLNTPKTTWGIQDLAKAQSLVALVRELEDSQYRVLLQPRGGLDYFSPDLEKAKVQLAAVTAMMDDIEPNNPTSPEIIHVVSYSEAVRLADPPIINESIQITQLALAEYRRQKAAGEIEDIANSRDLVSRRVRLMTEARLMIRTIEDLIPEPYGPDGFYQVMAGGFFPLPQLWEGREELKAATQWATRVIHGSVKVVGEDGKELSTSDRMTMIREHWGKSHE